MAKGADLGLRERKKIETRARIHRAAVELAAARGLDAVTVDEIADAAGVSTRTFFNYFPGKDQALVGLDPTVAAQYAEAILAAPAALGPLDCIEHVLMSVGLPGDHASGLKALRRRVIEENPHLMPQMFGAGRSMGEAVTGALAERLGVPASDPYPQLVVAVVGAALGATLPVASDADQEQSIREMFEMLRSGLNQTPTA